MEWYGRGPHENYSDRKYGAFLRRHAVERLEELHTPYIFTGACPPTSIEATSRVVAVRPAVYMFAKPYCGDHLASCLYTHDKNLGIHF